MEYLPEKPTSKKVHEVFDLQVALPSLGWMDPIVNYLKDGTLHSDKNEVKSLMYQAANYILINDVLYNEGLASPSLGTCIPRKDIGFSRSNTIGSVAITSRLNYFISKLYKLVTSGLPCELMPKSLYISAREARSMHQLNMPQASTSIASLSSSLLLIGVWTSLFHFLYQLTKESSL